MKKILSKTLIFLFFCGQLCFENVAFSQTTILSHLETTAQNNSESSSAIFMIGQCHFFNGKFAEATKQFEKAIDLDNENSNYYLFQALSYEAQGKSEQALDNYDKAISEESSAEYLIQRGYLRYKLKKYVGAAKDFREALETYEDMADLKKLLQDCEKNGGKADKETETNSTTTKITAEQPAVFIEKFLKQFERFSDAGELYRGMLYLFTNNYDKAIPVFEQFIKKDKDAESMFFNAIALELKNNHACSWSHDCMNVRLISTIKKEI
jgi:tetratricopeptide (TPR) repeat protein